MHYAYLYTAKKRRAERTWYNGSRAGGDLVFALSLQQAIYEVDAGHDGNGWTVRRRI